MMSPRRPIAAFLIFVSSIVLAVPGWASETVKLGDLPAISNAGIYIAMDKGYFQEHGVTVDAERFASAGKMTAPLATGQIDVSVGSPSAGLFNSIAGGMDFKIVADKGQVRPGYNFTPLIVRKDLVDSGKVKTLKDLKGLKIANGAKGINFDYFLAKMMESVGLTYGALGPLKPSLVCLHLSGYGRTGPRAAWPAYDYLMQAEAGFMDLTGEPGALPSRMGLSIVDYLSGITAAFALTAALLGAARTGRIGALTPTLR